MPRSTIANDRSLQDIPRVTQDPSYLAALERAEFKPLDFFAEVKIEDIFARPAPLDLDLGCGDGSFLMAMAQRHPERNILGTERMVGRIEKVCRKIAETQGRHVRLIGLESHHVTRHLLPANSVSVAYVLFPDPWPKRYHHPRRLIQDEFMKSLHRVLAPGGELRAKTDDLPYFQWMEKVWARVPGYERIEWAEEPDWPRTDFEQQFLAKGLPIYRARLRKV
jgi:tRNA (guanine-N7-)-methyltransferase